MYSRSDTDGVAPAGMVAAFVSAAVSHPDSRGHRVAGRVRDLTRNSACHGALIIGFPLTSSWPPSRKTARHKHE